MPEEGIIGGSFRDPSGFVFKRDGLFYRQINKSYREHYDLLINSGCYEELTNSGLLIPHAEAGITPERPAKAYKIIAPEAIPFVSYPYEWCFSQLKDAALTTLVIQKKAMDFGLSLKDCSAYNIQFLDSRPVFIDTLSFEPYQEGKPWVAYQQFCRHFLSPLALMAHTDIRLGQLLRVHIDGVPLDLAGRLLPFVTRLKFSLLVHIHLHARAQQRYADAAPGVKRGVSRQAFMGLIDSLEGCVRKLQWEALGTEWADYYGQTNYDEDAFSRKIKTVASFLDRIRPATVWDLGANTGVFSRLAADKGITTVAFDLDPAAVEKNYRDCRRTNEARLLPLLLDLTNPSPALGWHHHERLSLLERGPGDAVLALALIHHLAISNNLPLAKIASLFSELARFLIIEFVPKDDSQVKKLLRSREDIFDDYAQDNFESTFSRYFSIIEKKGIEQMGRVLYLMERTVNA